MNELPLDTPQKVKNVLEKCVALNFLERPNVEMVLEVLQDAYNILKAEHFDVFLSYAWGYNDCRKPLTDKIYSALQAAGYANVFFISCLII